MTNSIYLDDEHWTVAYRFSFTKKEDVEAVSKVWTDKGKKFKAIYHIIVNNPNIRKTIDQLKEQKLCDNSESLILPF